jgi:hypothetical protein
VDDQSVLVATQVKDDSIVAYEIDGVAELPLDLAWIFPVRFRCYREPSTDRTLSLRVTPPEFPQSPGGR